MNTKIYYDGDCPFCNKYTELVRLREAIGQVEMVNIRQHPCELERLQATGHNLDQGMVLEHEGQQFYGAEAMRKVAELSDLQDSFSKVNRAAFSSKRRADMLYPLMRAGRAATLFFMGRKRINENPRGALDLFTVFAHSWGVFSFLHLLYYLFYEGSTQVFPTTWALGLLGVYVAVRPRSHRAFVLLLGVTAVDAWLQMPVYSNHTVLRNFVLLAMLLSGLVTWLRGETWSDFMTRFTPAGRAMLVIMYIFGVFHKINTDFLDPSVSCAVALWKTMPWPLPLLDSSLWYQMTIYGTLIVETVILACLISRKFRWPAIIAGIAFHSLIAPSAYGFYPSFSALAICLHLLYLSPETARRITSGKLWGEVRSAIHRPMGMVAALAWFALLYWQIVRQDHMSIGLFWWPWAIWICALVFLHAREHPAERTFGGVVWSRQWSINLITALFFLNCFSPYLGLKNAQSMNMFANLLHEGGQSNHLIFRTAPGPFGYLNDLVKVRDGGGIGHLEYAKSQDVHVTYYDLLHQLERNPDAVVSFERAGILMNEQSSTTMEKEIDRLLHPRWVRNWFLFRPVDLKTPKVCSLAQ